MTARPSATPGRNGTTLAVIAREAGVSDADGLQGDQRPRRRGARDAPPGRGRSSAATATRSRSGPVAARQLLELIFHELESEWALEIVRGVERVAGRHQLAVVLTEMQGRRRPGQGWIEGALARRPMGVIAVFSDLSETMRDQLQHAGDPVRGGRPGRRAPPRHAVDRGHELERRPRRDPPPARPRPPADRRHRRPVGRPVQPGARGRLPGGDGRGRRARRREPRSATARSRSTRASPRGGGCWRARTARRRSSPATTSRRSASTRRPARRGCTSPRTSASSASTTCRSRAG